jgi:hypothetical protein
MTPRIFLLVLALQATVGCARKDAGTASLADGGPFLPETIGALSLQDPEAFPPEYRDAARAASAYVVRLGWRPELRFAQARTMSVDDVVLEVWPASAFSPKGRPRVAGGPGVTIHFNPEKGTIERALRWQ